MIAMNALASGPVTINAGRGVREQPFSTGEAGRPWGAFYGGGGLPLKAVQMSQVQNALLPCWSLERLFI